VLDEFSESNVLLFERRDIRSGKQVRSFVTDREPIFAGIDPYRYYIDRNAQITWRP
jgi:ABC-2 type transport system permease protein